MWNFSASIEKEIYEYFLNLIKGISGKSTRLMINSLMVKIQNFPTKIKNNTRMSILNTFIQHYTRGSNQGNRGKTNKQTNKTQKLSRLRKKVKLPVFIQDIILHEDNHKKSIRNKQTNKKTYYTLMISSGRLQDSRLTF